MSADNITHYCDKEISLDYNDLAKILLFQLVLGSKAFVLALLTCSANLS